MKESFRVATFFFLGMILAMFAGLTLFFWRENTQVRNRLQAIEVNRDAQIAAHKEEIERNYQEALAKKTAEFNQTNTVLQKHNDENEFRQFKSALISSAAIYGEVVKIKSKDVATYFTGNLHGPYGYRFDFPRAWGMPRASVWAFSMGVFPGSLFSLSFQFNTSSPTPIINTSPTIESYSSDNSPRWFYSADGDGAHIEDARLASFVSTDSALEACQAFQRLSTVTNGCERDSTGAIALEFVKDEGGIRCLETPCKVLGTVWFVPIPDYEKGTYRGLLIRHDISAERFTTDEEARAQLARYLKTWRPQQLIDGVKLVVSTFAKNTQDYQ
jgi:hypothetical protein